MKKELALVPSKYFNCTPVGMEIAPNTPIEDWLRIGEALKKANKTIQWWVGDWLNFGEQKYGEMYSQALETTGYDYGTLANFKWVASKVESSLRNENLSFEHHRFVADLKPSEQKKWLSLAEKSDVSAFELRGKIKKAAPTPVLALPKGKYDVIYADPPWQYEHDMFGDINRSIEAHYPTLELEEIKKIEVPSTENSILFLWATAPILKKSLEVMEAWGYDYRTCGIWDKEIIGMGYWFRGQHEILLIGVKGKFSPPPPSARVSSVYKERRTKHSRKPSYFYELIEKMYPHGKYLEIFARGERKNWTSYGNEL